MNEVIWKDKVAGNGMTDVEYAVFLRDYLNDQDEIAVTFTKKDGSERRMICTRNLGLIPSDFYPKNKALYVIATDVVQVFDLEKRDWRAFNISTVKNIEWNL